MQNPFTDHPSDVGETYFEHMSAALRVAGTLAVAAGACLVHAICPFLFERTGSQTIARLHRKVHKRVTAPDWERHPII